MSQGITNGTMLFADMFNKKIMSIITFLALLAFIYSKELIKLRNIPFTIVPSHVIFIVTLGSILSSTDIALKWINPIMSP